MKEVHILFDCYANLCGGFFYRAFLHLKCEFCLPVLSLNWVVEQKIPGRILIAIDAMNHLLCGTVFRHLLKVVACASTSKIVFQVIALDVDSNRVARLGNAIYTDFQSSVLVS